MEKKMRQPDQCACLHRHQGVHGFVGIEEPRPGRPGNLQRQRRVCEAPVKGVVPIPERGLRAGGQPFRLVGVQQLMVQ